MWIPPFSPFPLSEGQLKHKFVMCKYVTNILQNHDKIDDVTTGLCNYVILCFRGQSPTFVFRKIELKFGGGVNSEALISYFMSILSNKMNSIKIMGFMSFLN